MALVVTSTTNAIRRVQAIDCTGSGETYAEDCANARLIAAAPELLEALQAMVGVIDRAQGKPITFFEGMRNCAVTKARAAIAKATQQIVNEPSISEQRAMGIHFGIDE
jgi:hypothetical protein